MRIFIINLDKSTRRMHHISGEMARCNLAYTRVSAVDGLGVGANNSGYNPKLNKKHFRNPLMPGEVGCYLSHIECWKRIVEEDLAMALILEDDVAIGGDLAIILRSIEQLPADWDIIKLSVPPKQKKVTGSVPLIKGFNLCQYRKIPAGTGGLVVSHVGAQKLLESRKEFGRPVDIDLQFYWEFGGRIFGVEPFPIANSPNWLKSDIDSRGSRRRFRNPLLSLRGPIFRVLYELRLLRRRWEPKKTDSKTG